MSMFAALFVALTAHAGDGVRVEESRATFTTERMVLEVEDGRVVRLFNRLTWREYILDSDEAAPKDMANSLVYVEPGIAGAPGERQPGKAYTPEGADILEPALTAPSAWGKPELRKDSGSVEYLFASGDGTMSYRIRYTLDAATGDVLVEQKGNGRRNGLARIRFALGPVTCRGNLLLPVRSGIKGMRDSAFYFESNEHAWPTTWQFPMVIFHDLDGGAYVYAQDEQDRFKYVAYRFGGHGVWRAAVDTENVAPFRERTDAESLVWRINVYEGDWGGPVERYRDWAWRHYDMEGNDRQYRPDWVDDIRLVIRNADFVPTDEIRSYLDSMSKYIVPSKTLLVLNNWKHYPEPKNRDHDIPNFAASEHGAKFNAEARKRGFRTMYFTNYLSIATTNPRFEEFRRYFVRDPYTHQFQGFNLQGEWSYFGGYDAVLYYVNAAAKPWRDYVIGQLKELFEANPADGVYLDQTFNVYNDESGLIDGKTMIEGNIAFHEEVGEALPGVAMGGEGINELTFRFEAFGSPWYIGNLFIRDSEGNVVRWATDPDAYDRMVPVWAVFNQGHTRIIKGHHPIYGGIHALHNPSIAELEEADSRVRFVVREAGAAQTEPQAPEAGLPSRK